MTENPQSQAAFGGLRFLLTRPDQGPDCRLADQITLNGGKTISFPVIRLEPPASPVEMQHTLANLAQFSAVVFVSPSGVRFFLQNCRPAQRTLLAALPLIAIGQSTAKWLQTEGFQVVSVAAQPNSQSLAQLLIDDFSGTKPNAPLLVVRADRGSPELAARLTQSMIPFVEVVAYRSVDVAQAHPDLLADLESGQIDWIPLTSSSIAKNTIRLLGNSITKSQRPPHLASLSPAITAILEQLGFPPTVEAQVSTFASLLSAIEDYVHSK